MSRHPTYFDVLARSKRRKTRSIHRRLFVEPLENRELLAVLNLASGVDDGSSGSLREAITIANCNNEDDEIELSAGTYKLSLGGGEEDANQSGDLDFVEKNHTIRITGAGAETTFIDAGVLHDRVLHILGEVTVVLVGVTIQGGSGVLSGGGVLNEGTLTMQSVTITGNSAEMGGGIHNRGTLDLTGTLVSENTSTASAHEIENSGVISHIDRSISDGGDWTDDKYGIKTFSLSPTSVSKRMAEDAFVVVLRDYDSVASTLIADSTLAGDSSSMDFQAGTLTAGSIDDHIRFGGFQEFVSDSLMHIGDDLQDFELGDMIIVRVRDVHGAPISDAHVALQSVSAEGQSQGVSFSTPRTGSDGRTMFLTDRDAADDSTRFSVTVTSANSTDSITETFELSDEVWEVTLENTESQLPTQLDLALVIDTTGSMGDELEYLKVELDSIVTQVREAHPNIDIRFALITYRDHGDSYVTRRFDFTNSLDDMRANLDAQHAAGGGDYPEAVHLALEETLALAWRSESTARMVFLVADAPPHDEFLARTIESIDELRESEIRVFPVAASGAGGAEFVMRSAAFLTMGEYLFLTNHSGYGLNHEQPDTAKYDVETLAQLMFRKIGSELAGEKIAAGDVIEHVVLEDDQFDAPAEGEWFFCPVLTNDRFSDEADLKISSVTAGSHGGSVSIASDGRAVTYTPRDGFIGSETFDYFVDSDSAEPRRATVTMNVTWDWQNKADQRDVDGDGFFSPIDVLVVLNHFNQFGSSSVTDLESKFTNQPVATFALAHVDVDGDGYLAPYDVLWLINWFDIAPSPENPQ